MRPKLLIQTYVMTKMMANIFKMNLKKKKKNKKIFLKPSQNLNRPTGLKYMSYQNQVY